MSPTRLSRRRFLIYSGAVASIPVLAGCNRNDTKTPPQSGATNTKGSTAPGVLRYAVAEKPTTFDPHLCLSVGTWDILQNVFETLVYYNEKGVMEPVLAASLPKVSADGKTYTFTLRDNVHFHDGTLLTADAVKTSALRVLSKELASPRAPLTLDDVVGAADYMSGKSKELPGVQVVDPQTIRFVLTEPRAYFLDKLGSFFIASPAAIEKAPKNEQGVREIDHTCAVGTAPFQVKEYLQATKVILVANPNYWGEKPKLTRIERPVIINAKTSRNLYDSGELDMYVENVADYEADKTNPATQQELVKTDLTGVYYITMNLKSGSPVSDPNIRRALSLATDRTAIAEQALEGMVVPATGILLPREGDNKADHLPFDLKQATQILTAAGYTAAKPLTFTLTYSEGSVNGAKVCQVLKEQWKAANVEVNLQESEWGTLLKRMTDGDFDAIFSGWLSTPDQHTVLHPLLASDSENNHSSYHSPVFDAALAAADRTQDRKQRDVLYTKAEAIALQDAAIVPIVFPRDVRLVRKYVSGLRIGTPGLRPHTQTIVA